MVLKKKYAVKFHIIFLLTILLTATFVEVGKLTIFGEWDVSPEWTIGDEWTIGGAPEAPASIQNSSLTRRVASGNDDADESGTGVFDVSSLIVETESRVEGAGNANYKSAGVRFQNITVAQGATILNATMRVQIVDVSSDDMNIEIYGHDADNSSDFVDNANILNQAQRVRTTASVSWVADGLGVIGRKYTPELTSIIQELVDRGGWNRGNSLTLLLIANIDATKSGDFVSYDGFVPQAPELLITYVTYNLTLTSTPNLANYTMDGADRQTPTTESLANTTHQINFINTFQSGGITWRFAYWGDNVSNANPNRAYLLTANTALNVTYISRASPVPFTSLDAVFLSPMDNMFELDGLLEGNLTFRQMLLDISAYENHGVIYPNTHPYAGPTQTWGRIGKALEFDGVNDQITIPSSTSLNVSYGLTVELWFRVRNGTDDQKFLGKFNGTSGTGQWTIGIVNNTIYTELWTTSGNRYADSTSSETILDGVFYHVAMIYDFRDAYYTVYVSGRAAYNVSTDGFLIRNVGSNLTIGNLYGGSTEWMEGVIDEVRIYDYARSQGHIYADARTALRKFGSWSFTSSGRTTDTTVLPHSDITWDNQTEGTYDGYTGFTFNDPELPWVYSNNTYRQSFVRTLRYTAGFQQYLFYCTPKWTTNATGHLWNNHISWYWNFFRHGELQVSYELMVRPNHEPPIDSWMINFIRTTPYTGSITVAQYVFDVNVTTGLFNNSIPIVISAWIGSNNKQFTMRFDVTSGDVQNGTGTSFPPYTQAWDLIDANGNSHIIDWFDGWTVFGMKARSQRVSVNTWSRMEIESHTLFFITTALILTIVVGAFTASALIRPVGEGAAADDVLTPIVEPLVEAIAPVMTPIGEAIAPIIQTLADNPIVQAIAQLGHDVISALGGVAVAVGNALAPIIDPILNIGNAIISALISFLEPIWLAMANVINAIVPTFINLGDVVFGWFGWENGFSTLLDFVGNLVTWTISSISDFITFSTPLFVFFATFMAKFLSAVGTTFYNWGNMLLQFFAFLDGTLTSGLNVWNDLGLENWFILAVILYPLFLLEEASRKGIDAAITQVTFLVNIMAWIISVFLSVIKLLIAVIGRIIESIPVVE